MAQYVFASYDCKCFDPMIWGASSALLLNAEEVESLMPLWEEVSRGLERQNYIYVHTVSDQTISNHKCYGTGGKGGECFSSGNHRLLWLLFFRFSIRFIRARAHSTSYVLEVF